MNRRKFVATMAAATVAATTPLQASTPSVAEPEKLRIRFLGTGAADWNGRDSRGELRRLTSVLLDGHILVDFTATAMDMLPEGCRPDTILYTHSHSDHYNAEAAVKAGVREVYVSHTWYDAAAADFKRAAKAAQQEMPQIKALYEGEPVKIGDITFSPLAANHTTSRRFEQTLIFLIEKGSTRLLYATDTGGIPARSARRAGIDAHTPGLGITALIMEATMGIDHEFDYRIFTHSSVAEVEKTVKVLTATGRYKPATADQPVYLTHLARTLHGTQAELDATLPKPLVAAYDGLEIIV